MKYLILCVLLTGCVSIPSGSQTNELTITLRKFENGCKFIARIRPEFTVTTECPTGK